MKLLRATSALVLLVAVGLLDLAAVSLSASAGQPLGKVNLTSFEIGPSADGAFVVIRLTGTAPGLGDCTSYAELDVEDGEERTWDGTGVAVFTAADGDVLVGVITAQRDNEGAVSAEVRWRDSVTLHDGMTVASTGRFENHRPAGVRMRHCCCGCFRPNCACTICC